MVLRGPRVQSGEMQESRSEEKNNIQANCAAGHPDAQKTDRERSSLPLQIMSETLLRFKSCDSEDTHLR